MKNKLFILFFCFVFIADFSLCFSKEWKRAYLASFPRSGNHWVRYLVEEASHIATSSVYCDPDPQHMDKTFPWGGYCCDHGYEGDCRYPTKDDVVFIKTHYPGQKRISKFDKDTYQVIVRVVRHPVDSFYSRYVKNPKGSIADTVPSKRVKRYISLWRDFQTYWNNKPNVITILYEDMLENPAVELKKILDALEYDVTDEDIARAVAKYPSEGFVLKHLDKFKRSDLKLIANELSDLMDQFGYEIPL